MKDPRKRRKRRQIFFIHGEKFMAPLIRQLEGRGIDVSLMTSRGDGAFEAFQAVLGPDTLNLHNSHAMYGILSAELQAGLRPAPPADIERLASTAHRTLLMLDRTNVSGYAVWELYRLYLHLMGFWRTMLDELQPDAVVFSSGIPQFGFDYLLYELCRADGIPVLFVRTTYLEGRVMVIDDIFEVPGPTAEEIDKAEPPAGWNGFGSPSNDERDRLALNLRNIRSKFSPLKVAGALVGTEPWKQLGRVQGRIPLFLHRPEPRYIEMRWENFKGRLGNRKCLQKYDAIARQPDLEQPFVYFPLQTVPEESTVPLGGTFIDALHVIRLLSAALPKGWRIYVKEHPNQFNSGYLISKGRNVEFYDQLIEIPNVTAVPLEMTSRELIEKAKTVAVITGTSGWEALQMGKPALVFGYPFFLRAPGVMRVDSVASCAQALARVERGETVSIDRLRRYLWLMYERYTERFIYGIDFVTLDKMTADESAAAFAEVIDRRTRHLVNSPSIAVGGAS